MEPREETPHLSEEEFFRLALPPAGEPEAIPAHLQACAECARNLQVWKTAIRELGEEDEAQIAKRTPEEWEAKEDETMAAIRKSGQPGSQRRRLVWTLGLAASLLLAAFLLVRPAPAPDPAELEETADLSAADRADDDLLREISVLARGEEPGNLWNSLAPVPGAETQPEAEDNL
jgi:anti-sigma factor RsiW